MTPCAGTSWHHAQTAMAADDASQLIAIRMIELAVSWGHEFDPRRLSWRSAICAYDIGDRRRTLAKPVDKETEPAIIRSLVVSDRGPDQASVFEPHGAPT